MSAVIEAIRPHRAAIDGAVHIPLGLLAPSATSMQTTRRKHFDAKKLDELAESIRKHGVLQPILVRNAPGAKVGEPLYEIVAGERRWRASQLAEADAIPAIVREISDFDALELQVIENLQRDDLHPLEEAEGYEALMRKPDGLQGYASADELAARIGKSRAYVYGRLKLCALVDSARKAFLDGQVSASTALLIARMPAAVQTEATKKIVQGWGGEPMAYRAARDYLEQEFMLKLGSAPFKITDETLHAAAGSCNACGKRTGANPDLFEDIKSGDVCTDSACFGEKKGAHQARLIALAREQGREVIVGAAAKKLMPREYSNDINGYLKLDEVSYQINGTKTIGKLLGKDAPPTVLIEHPRTKELIEAVREDAAMAVLKQKGHVKTSRMPSTSESHRKAEAKAKAESAWRLAVAQRTIAASADPKFNSDVVLRAWLVPEFGAAMYSRLEYETAKRVCKLLRWDEKLGRGYDGDSDRKVSEHFHKLTGAQLEQAFVAMAIAGQVHVNSYGGGGKPERLLAFAGHLGVDAAAVRAELAAADKAKAKKAAPAPKAATKQAAKKTVAKKAASTAVKYRNAATGETWSGKGLQPAWLKAALKRGQTLADFDTTSRPAPAKPTNAEAITSVSFEGGTLELGDELRVKKTATGRKTAKDGRVGTVEKILEQGRIVLRWGARAHESGVYMPTELERVPAPVELTNGSTLSMQAAWPFPGR